MDTNLKTNGQNRPVSFLGGLLLGCLGSAVLVVCLIVSVITLIARQDINRYGGSRSPSSESNPSGSAGGASSPNDAVALGQEIFESRCQGCHSAGTQAQYGPGLAGLFSPGGPELPNGVDYGGKLPNGKDINDANIAEWIRDGGQGEIGHMPGHNFDNEEMASLIAYLKTLEK